MTVLKLTKSGNGLLVIDDDGGVFCTSLSMAKRLIAGELNKGRFLLMSRLPSSTGKSRFKKSPLYDPDGLASKELIDGLSQEFRKDGENRKTYNDEVVW